MSARAAPHWASIGESSCVLGTWFLYHLHRLCGRWPFRLCLYPVVVYYWATRPLARRASREYLQRIEAAHGAIGETPGWRHELRHFLSFAEAMLDKMLALSGRYRFERVRFQGEKPVLDLIAEGQGGVFITAHMGCLELCQAAAECRPGLKLTVLVHTRHAERWNRILDRLNPHSGVRLLQVTEVDFTTAATLQERVAQGEFVAITGDRVPVTPSKTIRLSFFGHDAELPVGPYVLASLLKCPVFLLACVREGEGHAVHFEQLAERITLPRVTREAAVRGYAGRFVERLEAMLRTAPYEWFNFFPFWDQSSRPPSTMTNQIELPRVGIDGSRLGIEHIVALAERTAIVALSTDPDFRARIQRGADFLDRLLREDGVVYGVTTGYGDSCTVAIPPALIAELPHHLYTYHGCGTGRMLTPEETRAVLAVRLVSLAQGYSGVSPALLKQIENLLTHDVLPLIPAEGSVGASGDLTPLSYLAAVLCGEREVWFRGERRAAAEVLPALGISPLRLRPKEGLAIMNGTAVMTALACLAWKRADYLSRLATRITACSVLSSAGNAHHFDEVLFSVKPHAGQQLIAARLRSDLAADRPPRNEQRLQDRYSLRCAPHVVGVLEDGLGFFRELIENELNSANDNPLIDGEREQVLHGGHFYGGHIAFAMDGLKAAVANVADLLDRQLALLVDARYSNGLPANLSGATGPRAAINHGLKALQISVSAWTAEALKLTMPASVFSRSTECHNQDKVSMGTIAARDALRVLELTEQVVAAMLIAARQGVALRRSLDGTMQLSPELEAFQTDLEERIELVVEDRALDGELQHLLGAIRSRAWSLHEDV